MVVRREDLTNMDRVLLCPPEISHAFSWLCTVYYRHTHNCTVYYRHTDNCTKPNVCLHFRQAVRSWLPAVVQHRTRQRTAWRILCHVPHRGQNARCSLLLSATVLLWEGHSCSHLTEILASQKKRNSLLKFYVYLSNNVITVHEEEPTWTIW